MRELPVTTIRRARPSDFPAVDALHAAAIRELAVEHYDAETIFDWSLPLDEDLFEEGVATTDWLVAEIGGEVVGAAQLVLEKAEVRMLYVAPRWAAMGVGRSLLAEMEAIARAHGVGRLVLRSSLNAVPFYLRCGWREVERTTHALRTGRVVPCVRMEKELGPAEGGTQSG